MLSGGLCVSYFDILVVSKIIPKLKNENHMKTIFTLTLSNGFIYSHDVPMHINNGIVDYDVIVDSLDGFLNPFRIEYCDSLTFGDHVFRQFDNTNYDRDQALERFVKTLF